MRRFQIQVINEVGLHARPAALFVQCANLFQSTIQVKNISNQREFVDAKGILSVLILGVQKDHIVEVLIEGEDEDQAANVLMKLIESDFTALPDELADTGGE